MNKPLPSSLPKLHREFLHHAIETLAQESWLIGIAAAGSFATDTMDAFSDLDFVLAVEDEAHTTIMKKRLSIAQSLGPLLCAFTGEHIGQPRLLLCLYGPSLLHVDLIFDTLADVVKRADDLVILWERDEQLSTVLRHGIVTNLVLNSQWIEDRFWVWIHKAGGKIGRGELFEAIEYLVFMRSKVLGPLGRLGAGQRPIGVRRVEAAAPSLAEGLKATLACHSASECLVALRACVELYRQLRASEGTGLQYCHEAENAVMGYLTEIEVHIKADRTPC